MSLPRILTDNRGVQAFASKGRYPPSRNHQIQNIRGSQSVYCPGSRVATRVVSRGYGVPRGCRGEIEIPPHPLGLSGARHPRRRQVSISPNLNRNSLSGPASLPDYFLGGRFAMGTLGCRPNPLRGSAPKPRKGFHPLTLPRFALIFAAIELYPSSISPVCGSMGYLPSKQPVHRPQPAPSTVLHRSSSDRYRRLSAPMNLQMSSTLCP